MILSKEYIATVVKDYFKDKPVKSVCLFGSYARGHANEDSDVDLAFSLKENAAISYFTLAGYLVELEKRFNKKVDLVEIQSFYPRIRNEFDSEKLILYKAI